MAFGALGGCCCCLFGFLKGGSNEDLSLPASLMEEKNKKMLNEPYPSPSLCLMYVQPKHSRNDECAWLFKPGGKNLHHLSLSLMSWNALAGMHLACYICEIQGGEIKRAGRLGLM